MGTRSFPLRYEHLRLALCNRGATFPSMSSVADSQRQRIFWLDAAKAYGMILVFYGHFVERVYQTGNEAALLQERLIYAFHMPLFIFIAGFFARTEAGRLWVFLKRGLLTRILPALFFSLLIAPGVAIEHFFPPDVENRPRQFRLRWFDQERFTDLCKRLASGSQSDDRSRAEIWNKFPPDQQALIFEWAQADSIPYAVRQQILAGLNEVVKQKGLFALDDLSYISHTKASRTLLDQYRADSSQANLQKLNVALISRSLWPENDEWTFGDEMAWAAIKFLRTGFPLNTPVWFVICLFVVELYHFLAVRVLRSEVAVALAIPAFWVSGAWLNHDVPSFSDVWFAREAILLYGIYLLGHLLRRTQALEQLTNRAQAFILLTSIALLLSTFNLNPGNSHPGLTPVVLINLSQHGDPFLFAVTALAGCFAVAGLSLFTPQWRWISWLGRNTLILMGLNGFFFAFVNHQLAGTLQLAESQLLLVGVCGLVTALSLTACVPFVWLLNRYVPWLVGRSRASTTHSERKPPRLT